MRITFYIGCQGQNAKILVYHKFSVFRRLTMSHSILNVLQQLQKVCYCVETGIIKVLSSVFA